MIDRGVETRDVVVLGAGPAGQKAAIQAAKAGRRVLVIEREAKVGGQCVHRGTIPSKTLREAGIAITTLQRRCGDAFNVARPSSVPLASLMHRVDDVVAAHESYMTNQLSRNGIERWFGRARFTSTNTLEVESVRGEIRQVKAEIIVIATGSRPRAPDGIAIDHENIFDSDSILSMTYLPRTLAVLGGGVVAYEYASIFQALGSRVVIVDPADRPFPFLDRELSEELRKEFTRAGGQILASTSETSVRWDGVAEITVGIRGGPAFRVDKVLCARGRVAEVEHLALENAELAVDARGNVPVNGFFQTAVPHIYAIGDVAGPPALASVAMDQGRRAMLHALGIGTVMNAELIPIGIYTIPEIASVGLSEEAAREQHGAVVVGRAAFDEVARGRINASDGMLKLVADPMGRRILGVQIVGEGAIELVHVGQVAIAAGMAVDGLVDATFNFPTMAEAYRIAALDLVKRRPQQAPDRTDRLAGALTAIGLRRRVA